MYESFIEGEEDMVKKNLLIDTLEWTYDQRILHFASEKGSEAKKGKIYGRKGTAMAKVRSSKPQVAHEELKKSYDILKLKDQDAFTVRFNSVATYSEPEPETEVMKW